MSTRALTEPDRIAAAECVRLIALLAESETPHSKSLASLVAMRLVEIADHGLASITPAAWGIAEDLAWSAEELEPWIAAARQLVELSDERG